MQDPRTKSPLAVANGRFALHRAISNEEGVYKEANGDVSTIFFIRNCGTWNLESWMNEEIKNGYGLNHPHIASISEVFFDDTNMCIVVPNLPEKTMLEIMNEKSTITCRHIDTEYQTALDSWMTERRVDILKNAPFTELDNVRSLMANVDASAVTKKEVINLLDTHTQSKLAAKMKVEEKLYKETHPKERYIFSFPEDDARWYFQQLILAMDYCHAKDVHLNYKVEHLYIDTTSTPHLLKVLPTDFTRYMMYRGGPPAYMEEPTYIAPEYLHTRAPINKKVSDVWIAGIILNIMLTGRLPYNNPGEIRIAHSETINRIAQGKVILAQNVSKNCIDLLQKILVTDPAKRITMAEIKAHPWFMDKLPTGALTMNEVALQERYEYPPIDHILDNFCAYVEGLYKPIPLPLGQFPELDDWNFSLAQEAASI